MLTQIALYSLIPTACMIIGGLIAYAKMPSARFSSAVQHFAAGVVFAAVAIELLPTILEGEVKWRIAIGFIAGTLVMLGVKAFSDRLEKKSDAAQKNVLPFGYVGAVGVDLFVDGLLIGVAFLVGTSGGVLLAVALAIEILFLGLAMAVTLQNRSVSFYKAIIIQIALAMLVLLGAVIGGGLIEALPKSIIPDVLAFGVAALLYLVTEELLVEAHEIEDKHWVTAAFFLGFLVILLLE